MRPEYRLMDIMFRAKAEQLKQRDPSIAVAQIKLKLISFLTVIVIGEFFYSRSVVSVVLV